VKLFRTLNDALQGFAVYDDAFRVPGRKRYNNQVRFRAVLSRFQDFRLEAEARIWPYLALTVLHVPCSVSMGICRVRRRLPSSGPQALQQPGPLPSQEGTSYHVFRAFAKMGV